MMSTVTFTNFELASAVSSPQFQSGVEDDVHILTPTHLIDSLQSVDNMEVIFPKNIAMVNNMPFRCVASNFETILQEYKSNILASYVSGSRQLKAVSFATTEERGIKRRTAVNVYIDRRSDACDMRVIFHAHLQKHLLLMARESQQEDCRQLSFVVLYSTNIGDTFIQERVAAMLPNVDYTVNTNRSFILQQELVQSSKL